MLNLPSGQDILMFRSSEDMAATEPEFDSEQMKITTPLGLNPSSTEVSCILLYFMSKV